MTTENGNLDQVPSGRFHELPLPAEPMNSVLAVLVASIAKTNHKHFILRDPLFVQVDNVVVMLRRSAAHAIGMLGCEPITVAALGGSHQNGTSSSSSWSAMLCVCGFGSSRICASIFF